MSTGAIIFAAMGSFALLSLIIVGVYSWRAWRKEREREFA